jgi:hypothetical protein
MGTIPRTGGPWKIESCPFPERFILHDATQAGILCCQEFLRLSYNAAHTSILLLTSRGKLMATAAAPSRALPAAPGRRYDKIFFSGMAVVMLGIVFAGFARSYFLAGVVRAPLPSFIIHVHGAVFSAWAILFTVQASLVATGNIAVHRKLGLWAFGLVCLMAVLGLAAATNSLSRNFAPPGFGDPLTFYAIPMFDIVIFAGLILFGYIQRLNPAAHKRLVLLATIALMDAPTGRPPFAAITNHPFLGGFFMWILVVLLMTYDLYSLRKIHPATIWGSVWLIILGQISVPIGMTSGWHAFAHAMQAMVRH